MRLVGISGCGNTAGVAFIARSHKWRRKSQIKNQRPDKNFGGTTVCSYESSGIWVAVITAQTSGWVCGWGLGCVRSQAERGRVCGVAPRIKGGWGLERSCSGPHPLLRVLWRCPTLPHPPRCSTIGACGLSFQVRNGCWAFPRGYDHHKWFNQYSRVPQCVGVVLVVIRIVV